MSFPTKFRPLLAATIETEADLANLQMPVWVSKKENGIRGLTSGEGCLSRTLKPIPNHHISLLLSELPAGIEGEIITLTEDGTDDEFESIESKVMTRSGKPEFQFRIFDWFPNFRFVPYRNRWLNIKKNLSKMGPNVRQIEQHRCKTIEDIWHWYNEYVGIQGAEGIMGRDPVGFYKFGRSTLNEQLLWKFKPWNDDEAVVIDVIEEMKNNNPKELDNLGLAKRSKHIANLQGKGTMGALLVKSKKFGEFKLGTGFTAQGKENIWDTRQMILSGKNILQYRYRGLTKYGKPKHAAFQKWIT